MTETADARNRLISWGSEPKLRFENIQKANPPGKDAIELGLFLFTIEDDQNAFIQGTEAMEESRQSLITRMNWEQQQLVNILKTTPDERFEFLSESIQETIPNLSAPWRSEKDIRQAETQWKESFKDLIGDLSEVYESAINSYRTWVHDQAK
jgi:hypothetical protein